MKLYRDMSPTQKRIADREHAVGQNDQKEMAELMMEFYDSLPPWQRDQLKEGNWSVIQ